MGYLSVLREAEAAGVKVEVIDGELQIEAKAKLRGWIPKLRQYKFELLAHYAGEAAADTPEEGDTGESVAVACPPHPFPVHTLPGPVGEFVAAAAAAIGCDSSFVALPLLACLARAIGNKRVIRLKKTWTEPAIIWAAIVGKSETHKTPAIGAVMQFLQHRESLSFAAHAEAAEKYEQELACYERDMAAWRKLKNITEQAPWKPEPPSCERFLTSDTTIEALAALLAAQFDGIVVLCHA